MTPAIKLTEAERLKIEKACIETARLAESIQDQMEPHPNVRESLFGTIGHRWGAVLFGLFTGIIVLLALNWLFGSLGAAGFLAGLGVPVLVLEYTPEVLALYSAATSAWFFMFSWGVEGRVEYFTSWRNAHRRAAVLHSVLGELSNMLLDAVPDFDDYAHDHEDDRRTPFVKRALGLEVEAQEQPYPKSRR
ncbi:hypothetical protein [Roseovarius mucosus]|uniref:hypothetical protein n=1 Tax=Roseovarius mucosus TaxID=215743 RepID=UPI003BAB108B